MRATSPGCPNDGSRCKYQGIFLTEVLRFILISIYRG